MGAKRIVKTPKPQLVMSPFVERWLSRRLIGGVLVLGVVIGSFLATMWKLAQPNTLPIQQVQVKGEFRYIDKENLYTAIGDLASAGFFNVDVRAIKQTVESLPWVDSASVRRVWPDTLLVNIEEQVPLARWREGGIVNRRGEMITVPAQEALNALPFFSGPEGTAMMLAKRYQAISMQMAKADLQIVALTLSERRAWTVSLKNGLQLLLGRTVANDPLASFAGVYHEVFAKQLEKMQSVDLRYTNGFAVRWKTGVVG